MNKVFEEGSIESIAGDMWGKYEGDVGALKIIEGLDLAVAMKDLLREALTDNYTEGFKQGFMLRLTGETDAHG